jgi:signal transduction histidine kinase
LLLVHRHPRPRRGKPRSIGRAAPKNRRASGGRPPLISLVTRASNLAELLPHLHRRAVDASGGETSLLFERDVRSGVFHASSGFGLELPVASWVPDEHERELVSVTFARRQPKVIVDANRAAPQLANLLGRRALMLLPLAHARHRVGLLIVGFAAPPEVARLRDSMAEVADAFLTTLDLFGLRQKNTLQKEVSELLGAFTDGLAATLDLAAGLDNFCHGARRLFTADRVSVWLHDRRARQLVLQSSSGSNGPSGGAQVDANDPLMPAVAAMKRAHADIAEAADDARARTLTVPLRGWRRALGAIVFEGVMTERASGVDLVELGDELGRQLSTVIESMQLLETLAGTEVKASPGEPGGAFVGITRSEGSRAHQADRLPALGVFVAGIAHELNNPLQGVLGHLELLRATGAFPKHLQREVQTIYREADRAAKIVRNLLMFAGSRRLARRRISLNAVLQRVIALRDSACRDLDIEIVQHYDDHLPRVQSDPLLLHQVFLNMVMNAEQAIAASGRPGRIEISTTVDKSGHRIIATVRDTGNGIPPDELARIFEPFYTTKEVGKGTGLGLAIAYGIVHEHGGEISAANAVGGGAVFTVELPALPAPSTL